MAKENKVLVKGETQQVELVERRVVAEQKDADGNVTNANRAGNFYWVCLFDAKVFTVRSQVIADAIEAKRLHSITLQPDKYDGNDSWNFVTATTRDQHFLSLRDDAMEAKYSKEDAFEDYDFFAALDVKAVAKASA